MNRVAPLVLALLLSSIPGAAAQNADGFRRCGDDGLVLVFMNPDLAVQNDGFIHASGSFFIQFQARGEKAFDIETFKFSFGKDLNGVESCATPEWVTGAYVKNYRADYDPRDGFFIPINTCLVPDGEYAAAISAYDKDLRELVRYYAKAKVDNGGRTTGREPCDQPDKTAPWPMILPGDGERLDGGQGLYIEVGEPVASIEGFLNGRKIALTEGLGPARDDDLAPDFGYTQQLRDSPAANSQLQSRQYPTFTWDGVLTPGDVVRVRVVDKWGNFADKVVHLGDPTIGGRVTGGDPVFELQVDEKDKIADANGTAAYNVSYITKSPEGLHADLHVEGKDGAELPKGMTYRLTPDHVMMGGNSELKGEIRLIATPETPPGTYTVTFVADYLKGSGREQRKVDLVFRLDAKAETDVTQNEEFASTDRAVEQQDLRGGDVAANQTLAPAGAPEENGIPFPSLPWALAALAGAVLLARRRR